jgi:hypothetical protein
MCLLHTVFGQTAKDLSKRTSELVEQFKTTTTFWKQFEVAKQIVALHDKVRSKSLKPGSATRTCTLEVTRRLFSQAWATIAAFKLLKPFWKTVHPNEQCSGSTTQAARALSYKFGKTVTTPHTSLGTRRTCGQFPFWFHC